MLLKATLWDWHAWGNYNVHYTNRLLSNGQEPNQRGADMSIVSDYACATDATVERAVKHFAEGYN